MSNDKHNAAYHDGVQIFECPRVASKMPHAAHQWSRRVQSGSVAGRHSDPTKSRAAWCSGYHGAEQPDTPSEADGEKGSELGPVGKVVVSVVALAILTPFIGILWAWALNVVRDIGGF